MSETNQGGAPKGNKNALRHGLRSARLPREARYIELAANHLRREIEAVLLESEGEIGPYKSALIQSACRHERRAMLAERWLRVEPDLKLSEKLDIQKTISQATDARDKCIEKLGLDKREENDWSFLKIDPPAPAGD